MYTYEWRSCSSCVHSCLECSAATLQLLSLSLCFCLCAAYLYLLRCEMYLSDMAQMMRKKTQKHTRYAICLPYES